MSLCRNQNMEVIIMTLGEKLKCARRGAGFSQEQLAEKLCVSRQAVTKWESDKGMPDVGNRGIRDGSFASRSIFYNYSIKSNEANEPSPLHPGIILLSRKSQQCWGKE